MTLAVPQTSAFIEKEGDAWFERNRGAYEAHENHFECELLVSELAPFRDEIDSLLEIGCGDGHKTDWLARFFDARAAGLDPSGKAIDYGRKRFGASGRVDLRTGTADKLPWADASFDIVYFGFCLYLVGRTELLAAVAEADRVLKYGGFLVILDFDPHQPHRREYHHRQGLFSYKQDYPALFTGSAGYHLFAKRSFSHSGRHFTTDPSERVAMSFLYKEKEAYATAPAPQEAR